MTVYEFCDLKWGSITASGFIALCIGIGSFFFPRHAVGFIITYSTIIILVLAGILIAEGLFIEGGGSSRWLIVGIGAIGVFLALISVLNPAWIIVTGGIIIGICLIIFGCLMVLAAATIIFDFFVRSIVAFSSFGAILLGVYLILTPENSLLFFSMAVGTFLILYGVVRVIYGIRLREWQKSCPAPYFNKK